MHLIVYAFSMRVRITRAYKVECFHWVEKVVLIHDDENLLHKIDNRLHFLELT